VEAALTLPLTLFLILGTMQLFMMLQGRILAEYAAFRATRAGSLNHGDCKVMEHAAIISLMPSIYSFVGSGSGPAQGLAQAFERRKDNQYYKPQDGVEGTILWIVRTSPDKGSVPSEDLQFDQGNLMRLETQLIYFFPMRIPVVNAIISRIVLARFGWESYEGMNPLMVSQKTRYEEGDIGLAGAIRDQVMSRYENQQYVIPIMASGSMRMMTPARRTHFQQQNCSAPESL
jgi:hypothetical protein